MIDRVVQYPARFKFVPVAGTTDTFDLVAVPGIVSNEGTNLDKSALLSDATAAGILGSLPPEATTPDAAFAALKIDVDSKEAQGSAAEKVEAHNENTAAHTDIRQLIAGASSGGITTWDIFIASAGDFNIIKAIN